ncbi:MAG: hypothetical protein KC583_03225 [Myxococcales bacterium]|nr:hypothetical protein [Myxococcales bacterium]
MTLTDAHVQRPGHGDPSEKRIARDKVPAVLRQRCIDCARTARRPLMYQAAGRALLRVEQRDGREVLARVELRRMLAEGRIDDALWRAADEVLALIGIPAEVQVDIELGPVPA